MVTVKKVAPTLQPNLEHRARASGVSALGRAGWVAGIGALTVLVVGSIVWMQTGLHGDPRVSNPLPGPQPVSPFLGVENWAPFWTAVFPVLAVAIVVVAVRRSRRMGSLHRAIVIFLAMIPMTLTDPVSNWSTFTIYDPQIAHYPTSWVYMRFSPLVEPVISLLGGYMVYFILLGLVFLSLFKRLANRARPDSWLHRHPILGVFGLTFIVSFPVDLLFQLFFMRSGMYLYTQGFGPNVHLGQVSLPTAYVFYDAFIFAGITALLLQDDRGQSLVLRGLARRMRSGEPSLVRQMLVGIPVIFVIGTIPIGVCTVARVAGLTHPTYDTYRYPEAKVYDPYRELEEAGKPGPYFAR